MGETMTISWQNTGNLIGGYDTNTTFGDSYGPTDIKDSTIGKTYAGESQPFFYPAAIAESASRQRDPKEKRSAQLIALGAAAWMAEHARQYPGPAGTRIEPGLMAQSGVVEVLRGVGKPTILEVKESPANDILTAKLKQFIEKHGVPNGEPLEKYNWDVLKERNTEEEAAAAKAAAEKKAAEAAAAKLQLEAKTRAAETERLAHEAAVKTLVDEGVANLKKDGLFSNKYVFYAIFSIRKGP